MVKTIVEIDLGNHIQNKGEQLYTFDKEVNNVSRRIGEQTRRNWGSNLYMYGNDLRPLNMVGKDLSYDGFRWNDITDDEGYCDLTMTVTAKEADGLVQAVVVYGDFNAMQYATEAVLDDGKVIKSDDDIWAIRWDEPAHEHSVTFKRWNRAQYNPCITHIHAFPSVLEFDSSQLRHVDTLAQMTGQRENIWYGVIWNRGSVDIYDNEGEIFDYINDGIIEDSRMEIRIKNKGRYGTTYIQTHINGKATYSIGTRMLHIELENKLADWHWAKYPGRALTAACSAWELFVEVFGTMGYTEEDVKKMCQNKVSVDHEDIEITIEEYFKRIEIPFPYLEPSSFRDAITKFCQLGQLWCYCEDDDQITFITARPKAMKGDRENAIVIPDNIKYGPEIRDVFLRNKYRKVIVPINKISKEETSYNLTIPIYEQLRDENGDAIEISFPLMKEKVVDVVEDENEDIIISSNITKRLSISDSFGHSDEDRNEFATMLVNFDIGNLGWDKDARIEWTLNFWERGSWNAPNPENAPPEELVSHTQIYKPSYKQVEGEDKDKKDKELNISSLEKRYNYPYVSGQGKYKYAQIQYWGAPANMDSFVEYFNKGEFIPEIVKPMMSTIGIFKEGTARSIYIAANKTYERYRYDIRDTLRLNIANSINLKYTYIKLNSRIEDNVIYR